VELFVLFRQQVRFRQQLFIKTYRGFSILADTRDLGQMRFWIVQILLLFLITSVHFIGLRDLFLCKLTETVVLGYLISLKASDSPDVCDNNCSNSTFTFFQEDEWALFCIRVSFFFFRAVRSQSEC
jgi:hypothetical protein